MTAKSKSKSGFFSFKRILLSILFAGSLVGGWFGWNMFLKSNVHTDAGESEMLYVKTGTTMLQLVELLRTKKIISNVTSFEAMAKLKDFTNVKPGRYRIRDGMNNRELINMLKTGLQEKVSFTFNGVYTREQLAGRIGGKLEADSAEIFNLLSDQDFLARYGMNENTILTLFVPNTYSFYWTTSPKAVIDSMASIYKSFWTSERKQLARSMGLSQSEVITLASIVEAEQTRFADERATIAGLYMNRLAKNMPLQSDPTVIYALGDFSIQRVLHGDLDVNSPYNTYRYSGLPPGPIRLPRTESIDAVLSYKHNNYIYMCAEFGTGRHKFTSDYKQHLLNAKTYQDALDKASIAR
jgi:UPF0755 protein